MKLYEIFSDAAVTAPVINDTMRFWFHPATQTFVRVPRDCHHAEMVAVEPGQFGLSVDAVNTVLDRHEQAEEVEIPRPPTYQDARHGYLYSNHDLIALAMVAGWTRGVTMHPNDTAAEVEAATERDLHRTSRWLADHMRWGFRSLIYDLGQDQHGKLHELDLDSFIRTGRIPRPRF